MSDDIITEGAYGDTFAEVLDAVAATVGASASMDTQTHVVTFTYD